MSSGGARAKSGPPPDPGSGRSERRALKFSALPHAGHDGDVPDLLEFMPDATERHVVVWNQLWSTPQACAWAVETWRWPVVADLVKWSVRSDEPDAPASTATSVRQLREDLGLSAAGLKHNGWAIAAPLEPDDEATSADLAPANVTDIKNRLTRGKT